MITSPKLPPKLGYVEVEKGNGIHTYRNVATGILIEDESNEPTQTEDTMSMLVDHEYRITMMELGVSAGAESEDANAVQNS
jgi:hypothetical protein